MNKILREVIVPHNQFKLTHNEIDAEIIVFDGSNSTSPTIKPPDDVLWRSISVNQLHVEDDTLPNIGLTYLKVIGIHLHPEIGLYCRPHLLHHCYQRLSRPSWLDFFVISFSCNDVTLRYTAEIFESRYVCTGVCIYIIHIMILTCVIPK